MKLFLCVVAAAAGWALAPLPVQAQRMPVQAPATSVLATSSYITFGMAGIAMGQTARVNALNLAAGGPIILGGSCQVTVTFLDETGKPLATQTLPAGQGQSVHFDLPASATAAGVAPMEIRATVSAAFSISASATMYSAGYCSILPTMEIFDQGTGQTTVHLETTHPLSLVMPLTASPQ